MHAIIIWHSQWPTKVIIKKMQLKTWLLQLRMKPSNTLNVRIVGSTFWVQWSYEKKWRHSNFFASTNCFLKHGYFFTTDDVLLHQSKHFKNLLTSSELFKCARYMYMNSISRIYITWAQAQALKKIWTHCFHGNQSQQANPLTMFQQTCELYLQFSIYHVNTNAKGLHHKPNNHIIRSGWQQFSLSQNKETYNALIWLTI